MFSAVVGADMNTTDLSWAAFSSAFGDACSLIDKRGDRVRILAALEQAREALNDLLDDIPTSSSNIQVAPGQR